MTPQVTTVRIYFGWTSRPMVATSFAAARALLRGGATGGVIAIDCDATMPLGPGYAVDVSHAERDVARVVIGRDWLKATTCSGSLDQLTELEEAVNLAAYQRAYNQMSPTERVAWLGDNPELASLIIK